MTSDTADAKPRLPETDPSSGKRPEPVPRTLGRRVLAAVCGTMLMAMMALTVCDVIGRYVFAHPVTGATELTEMMLVGVIFLGLPAVSLDRDHVAVDILTDRLPGWIQPWRELLVSILSAAILGVISWRIWIYAGQIASYGGATNSLRLPVAPLGYLCATAGAVAAVFMAVVALRDLRR
ncbi:TRAP transporter small permease [Paenirhodobacter populi]|nr:TRAP transporter small permease [Sinirhodobacter populi]